VGRPVSLKRRKELALAAFEVIRARGRYGITMSELAENLGMKRPTLYWYFRDLGHVFETVLEHTLERQKSFLLNRLQGLTNGSDGDLHPSATEPRTAVMGPHPVDLLMAYAEAIWDFFAAEGPYLLQLVSFWGQTIGGEPGRVIEVTQRQFLPLWHMAVTELERGIADERVAPCDAAAVVDLISSVIDGALIHRIVRGMPMKPVRDLLWSAVLGPLRIPRRQGPIEDRQETQNAAA